MKILPRGASVSWCWLCLTPKSRPMLTLFLPE